MHILRCLQRPCSNFLQRCFQRSQGMILCTDLKTVAFINLACVHLFLLEKGAQVLKLKSRPIFWTQMNIPFLVGGVEARYD